MNLFEAIKMNCRDATYLHEKKKEGLLSLSERFGLWVHLLYCKFCNLFFMQMETIEQSAKQLPEAMQNRSMLSVTRKAELQKAFGEELKK